MATRRMIPQFATEAEEAQWWFEHADEFVDDFDAAAADGTLGHGTMAKRFGLGSNLVQLTPYDAQLAREQAAKQGVTYEAYIQELVHEALTAKTS